MMRRFPDIAPSRSSVMRRRADILEMRFGEGAIQRMPRFAAAAPAREWQLVFSHLDRSDAGQIDRFLESHRGVDPFLWSPPAGVSGRYLCAVWQIRPVSARMATVTATFLEDGFALERGSAGQARS